MKVLSTHKKARQRQRGVVLVFTVFWVITMIALLAVVIDLGRLFILARNIQNAADAAALVGAQSLQKSDPSFFMTVPKSGGINGGWTQVKPRIRFALYNMKFQGTQQITNSFVFNLQTPSHSWDEANFQGMEGQSGSGNGVLNIKVERGLVCYNDGNPTQQWIPLDEIDQYYCIANAVEATISASNIPYYFAPFFGINSKNLLTRRARSHVRRAPPLSCGDPPCSQYFGVGGYTPGAPFLGSIVCP